MHQARKRFGQHFLVDDSIIQAIVRAIQPSSQLSVIEIGPGLGALTRPLLERLTHLDLLEIDRDLVAYWHKQNLSGLHVIEGDALHFDFRSWAKEIKKQDDTTQVQARACSIVGNLPYNISSPLLFHLIEAADLVYEQVFMLQAEVVERMVAAPQDSAFGRLSVMLQARYHMEQILEVPPDAFDPPPRVNSAVVRMIPRPDFALSPEQWHSLEKITTLAFAQRRKMLRGNLESVLEKISMTAEEKTSRAQDISVERYIEWAKQLLA